MTPGKNLNFFKLDWILVMALVPLLFFGLITMSSFTGENYLASKQLLWIVLSLGVFIAFSFIDWRFIKRTDILVGLFLLSTTLLALLFMMKSIKGARSWFDLGSISLQPADFLN